MGLNLIKNTLFELIVSRNKVREIMLEKTNRKKLSIQMEFGQIALIDALWHIFFAKIEHIH